MMMCQLDTPDCPTLQKLEAGEIKAYTEDGCAFEYYYVVPKED